jgi:GntR family transcriptional regulator/MocR family aminotransferase
MDKKALILEKSPNEGLLELRQEIRLYLARNKGIHASVEQIIIGSGAEYLYNLIIALLGRNKIYGIEKPSYKKIEQVYRSSGVEICMLPLSKDGIDTSSLLSSKTDILHTTPYRSYPTGVTATASKRHEYIRWASTNSRYIVEDDFESEFSVSSKPEETLFSLSENDNVVYMNTFSKTVSPALRVGYMVLPKHLVEDFKNKLGFLSCTVPTFEQLLLTELISSGDFERHINRVRRKKRKEI